MYDELAKMIRYVSLAKVADKSKDKQVLTEAAAEIMDAISDAYIKNKNIIRPLEKLARRPAIGEGFDEFDDMDDEFDDMEDEDFEDDFGEDFDDEDMIDTEVIDEYDEPIIAEDEDEEDDDVIVVEEDEDQEDISDTDKEEESEKEDEEGGEEEEEEGEESTEASFIPTTTRRRAIATANRLSATDDPKTRKIANSILRRIVQ